MSNFELIKHNQLSSVSSPRLEAKFAGKLDQKLAVSTRQIEDIIKSGLDTPQKKDVVLSKIAKARHMIEEDTIGGTYLNKMYDNCKKLQRASKQSKHVDSSREAKITELILELGHYPHFLYLKHIERNKYLQYIEMPY